MTSFCFSFFAIQILIAVNEIEGNDYGSFRSDLNSEGRPILRGGLEDLLDNINLDINVRVEPKKPNSEAAVSLLRKRPKSSEELNSDIDEKLPDLRTAGPDVLAEPNDTEEALTFLRKDDDKEDKSPEDEVIRLITTSKEDKSPGDEVVHLINTSKEESREAVTEGRKIPEIKPAPSSNEADNSVESQTVIPLTSDENTGVTKEVPLRMGTAGTSEWMKDLRSYVKILANRYRKDGMLAHMKPVIKVLERTHKVKIRDIDVNENGKVNIDYVRKG